MQLLAHDLPGSQIVLLGLLPRGDRDAPDPYAQPSKYTPALDQINQGYRWAARDPLVKLHPCRISVQHDVCNLRSQQGSLGGQHGLSSPCRKLRVEVPVLPSPETNSRMLGAGGSLAGCSVCISWTVEAPCC